MQVWDLNIQRMLDFIELHLTQPLTLGHVAKRLGYSPWYCTRQFHRILGVSFRSYIASRRLSAAAIELRDTDVRILDLALRWGFSSQEAFSRSFKRAFGISPGAYRRCPVPLILAPARRAYLPILLESSMNTNARERVTLSFQTLPAHRFLGLRQPGAADYNDFWAILKERGTDCYAVLGLLDSLPAKNDQIGGWYQQGGVKGYLYGIEVPEDYSGPIPEGLECLHISGGDYAVFHHPPYDFETEDRAVFEALRHAMEAWDPTAFGWSLDEARPIYQRHGCETFGQAFCRPVRRS